MLRLVKVTVPVAAVLLALGLVGVSGASSAATSNSRVPSHSATGFWLAAAPGESFKEMVVIAATGGQAQGIGPTIAAMLSRVKRGEPVTIPSGSSGSVVNVPATAAVLKAALQAEQAVAGSRSLSQRELPVSPSADPGSWPIFGYGCNPGTHGYFSWCIDKINRRFEIVAEKCNPDCEVKDRIDITSFTVDPTSTGTTRVRYQALYSPDNGDFIDVHFEWWTLCYRSFTECGHKNTPNFNPNGPGSFNPSPIPNRDLHGDYVTFAAILWGYLTKTGQWVGWPASSDGGKPARTAKAECADRPDDNCYF